MHGIRYRSDIDGLRTIAVVPVILFHLGFGWMAGGFVGVDVFFVISGFLITAAIRREIEERHFTILGFYERRVRRIFPALFVMMLACLIAGFVLFLPDDFRELGASLLSAALFVSNIFFWFKADYFNGPVDLKPLLHTWSLAVEEQYYIVLPVFLWALARYHGRRYVGPVAIVALASFVASVAMTRLAPSGAYYLLPSRAWELLLGSLLSLDAIPAIKRQALVELSAAVGLVAILASAVLLSEHSAFPGVNALWPCLGAALILHAGSSSHHSWVAHLLGTKPFVFVGLISYSLYLWHWPLIVFTKYQVMGDLGWPLQFGLLAASFIAATLSWRFVERPFRNRRVSRRFILRGGVVAILAASVLGGAVFIRKGVPERFAGLQIPTIARADNPLPGEPTCFLTAGYAAWAADRCSLARGAGPVTLLWSDSHGYQYRRSITATIAPRARGSILLYASAGCLPLFGISPANAPDCAANNRNVWAIIRRYNIRRVVLAGHWQAGMEASGIGFDRVAATIKALRDHGVEVRMIGDNPDYAFGGMEFLAYRLEQRPDAQRGFYLAPKFGSEWNRKLSDQIGASAFFDPRAVLCRDERKCLVFENGQAVMSDNSHLSFYGADRVARAMGSLFD